ncbi:MAG: dephospho-CoA kinase [Candidatus Omnitrophica bacterium]|jgi:dephospho-CoA kinase|nr:dephospho-CoA kinase [Candidatus Omnitrophota bacterium]
MGFGDKKIIAVVGCFGSGKTTVAKLLAGRPLELVNADKIAHQALKDPVIKKLLLKEFGTFARKELSEIVFTNKKRTEALNRITHPWIIGAVKKKIKKARSKTVILDAPLLIEAGLSRLADKIIFVKASKDKIFLRLKKRDGLNKAQIGSRNKMQLAPKTKMRFADLIIDNNATLKKTKQQVMQIRRSLWRS